MKSVLNLTVHLGLLSGAMLGMFLGAMPKTIALPQSQTIETPQQKTVFVIGNENGSPLVATSKQGNRVTGVFISRQDAHEFVSSIKHKNPELGQQLKVFSLSMDQIDKLQKQSAGKTNGLNFVYIPKKEEDKLEAQQRQQNEISSLLFLGMLGLMFGGNDNADTDCQWVSKPLGNGRSRPVCVD